MSNRQARREQQRTNRPTRPTGNRPARPGATPPKRSGGGPDLLSRPFLLVVSAVVVLLAVVLGVYMVNSGGGSDSELVTKLQQAKSDLPTDLINGASIGKDSAPYKLVTFEDFQCPFCLKYTAEQEGELINKYVKSGQLQITYKHLPILGAESVAAAKASQCAADQGQFWQYHNTLFAIEAEAGQFGAEKLNVGRFSDTNLKAYANQLGLDATAFAACLDSGKYDELLVAQSREAKELGVSGVPAFTLNGQSLGSGIPADPSAWTQLFDRALQSKP